MVDFREYLEIEDYLLKETKDIFDYMNPATGELEYDESPFKPIEIGSYILYLYASEQNFCVPQLNTFDKYFYQAWELSVEKYHLKYGYVICTAEIMNELGFDEFTPDDYYVAYADIELVQTIFEHLLDKLNLPEI